jgi:hypothetical protein
MFGGLQWRQSVTRSIPTRPASVGRPQHSQLDGRTQLMTLPPIVGCTAPSVWLLRLRRPPCDAARDPGNGTTTIGSSPFLLQCVCQAKPSSGVGNYLSPGIIDRACMGQAGTFVPIPACYSPDLRNASFVNLPAT